MSGFLVVSIENIIAYQEIDKYRFTCWLSTCPKWYNEIFNFSNNFTSETDDSRNEVYLSSYKSWFYETCDSTSKLYLNKDFIKN